MHHRLAVSPEARRLFRAQIALRGLARNPKVLHTPASELRAKLFERLEREEGMKPQAPLPAPPVHAAEMARPVPSPTASGDARRRRRGIVWLLPTAVAAIVAVAVIWKPGQPLARPDGTAIADGSVRSSTGYGTAEPPALGSTGASSDAAVQRDIPVREAPPQAAMKAAPSSQSASGGASAPRPSSVSRGTASGDGQS